MHDGAFYAAQARAFFSQKDYQKAVISWQKCAELNYDFMQTEDTAIDNYTYALANVNQYNSALRVWNEYLQRFGDKVHPDRYQSFAMNAVAVRDCATSLKLIDQFITLGGLPNSHTYFIRALSLTNLRQNVNALSNWSEYFALKDPDEIPANCFYYAAEASHYAKEHKKAKKYMDRFLESTSKNNKSISSEQHCLAAQIFQSDHKDYKAVSHWEIFFASPDSSIHPSHYLGAAMAFYNTQQYQKGLDLFKEYYAVTPKKKRLLFCVFFMGELCAALNDPTHAAIYFDEILEANPPRQKVLANDARSRFLTAASTYLVLGQREKVAQIIALHDSLKPDAPPLVNDFISTTNKKTSVGKKKNRVNTQKAAKLIKSQITQLETQRCDDLAKNLNGLSFEFIPNPEKEERARAELLVDLFKLKEELAALDSPTLQASHGENSTHGGTPSNLLALREKVIVLERRCNALASRQRDAEKADGKAKTLAYLQTLGCEENDLVPLAMPTNLRAQYGHAKPAPQGALEKTPQASQQVALSSTAKPTVEVTFSALPHVAGQLGKLTQIPGHAAKYDAYMAEITADPAGHTRKSGHFKALVGEQGLFAYRFDKGNRLTYRTVKTGENTYNVTILSAFGHYKNLKTQISQSHAKDVSSHATSSTAQTQKSAPAKKGKAKKGKKRR
ncbi:MAG: hypothetical protein C0514_06195 [Candidatus Puniceispirillum sp.]|nr:hypothetical protein [Candidatus Puniceispirillum sp.]